MTTRYTEKHYEDVASILHEAKRIETDIGRLLPSEGYADEFADLFAADNPQRCTAHIACPYNRSDGRDNDCHIYGFNRARFLAACGIEG